MDRILFSWSLQSFCIFMTYPKTVTSTTHVTSCFCFILKKSLFSFILLNRNIHMYTKSVNDNSRGLSMLINTVRGFLKSVFQRSSRQARCAYKINTLLVDQKHCKTKETLCLEIKRLFNYGESVA